jgi:hypothetical protein
MVYQFRKVMKRHSFVLRLLMLIALGTSLNACVSIIANYQITAQEPKEGRANLASKDDAGPVYVVIPQYYRFQTLCKGGVFASPESCRDFRDYLGTQIYQGISSALGEVPLGKPVEFTEHIASQGLVCVVTVTEQLNSDTPYNEHSEILSAVTLFTIPAYTTRKYILSYSLYLDVKPVKEYEYRISEKAISGWTSWMLFPVMYLFWSDIEISVRHESAAILPATPPSSVIKEMTKRFLLEAHQDGIFKETL